MYNLGKFLPTTPEELEGLKIKSLDIILVTGDAYVDHPSFGVALLGRYLESHGYKVGIIAQPENPQDIARLGKPNLFFGITSGNVDSMVANYTASRKKRKSDDYTPGGINNKRPDRAVIQYVNWIKQVFKDVKVVIGGIEASLRRFAHYDWWSDKVRKSILIDSKADILVYGMGERAILEIAKRLEKGKDLDDIRGTMVWKSSVPQNIENAIFLPTFEEVSVDKKLYGEAYKKTVFFTDPYKDYILIQKQDNRYVFQYPPALPLTQEELDELYLLPYTREVHPFYLSKGEVKAIETVRFSITAVRGCFGNCSFCAITNHQSTHVVSRSVDSIIEEAKILTRLPDFRGTIVDVGGPTANMYGLSCQVRNSKGQCEKGCLHPRVCKLSISGEQSDSADTFISLLKSVKSVPGVKHVFIGSGLRHDLILASSKADYIIDELVEFTSGQLKLAPEHAHPKVLKFMHKPSAELFLDFKKRFEDAARRKGQKKYVIGYFIVAHPGEGPEENKYLREFIKRNLGYIPQQVQIFTPTPGTLSTTMYYTGFDPFTGESVYVEKSEKNRNLYKENIINLRK
ncbi:MAG: YgiQ family radical SAM protein [Fervidobacterium sp.]|uniref:YgiQ family radical SAM protein n=1 Tax=Fervidobacterium sp. TaxID=1871331 RepID=UPI00404B4AFD